MLKVEDKGPKRCVNNSNINIWINFIILLFADVFTFKIFPSTCNIYFYSLFLFIANRKRKRKGTSYISIFSCLSIRNCCFFVLHILAIVMFCNFYLKYSFSVTFSILLFFINLCWLGCALSNKCLIHLNSIIFTCLLLFLFTILRQLLYFFSPFQSKWKKKRKRYTVLSSILCCPSF